MVVTTFEIAYAAVMAVREILNRDGDDGIKLGAISAVMDVTSRLLTDDQETGLP